MSTQLSVQARYVLEDVHPRCFAGSGDYAVPETGGEFLSWLVRQRLSRKLSLRGEALDEAVSVAVCVAIEHLDRKLQKVADQKVDLRHALRWAANEGVRYVMRGAASPRPDDCESSYPSHQDALNRRHRRGVKRGGGRIRTARPISLGDIDPPDRASPPLSADPPVQPTEQPVVDYAPLEKLVAELPANLRPTARLVGYGLRQNAIAERQSVTQQCISARIARMAEHLGHPGTEDREPRETVTVAYAACVAALQPAGDGRLAMAGTNSPGWISPQSVRKHSQLLRTLPTTLGNNTLQAAERLAW